MTVNVKFIGSFRGLSGRKKLALNVRSAISLSEAIEKIVQELPKLEQMLIDAESGSLKTSILVLVNGKEIGVLSGFETPIGDGDEVVFVPVVHGG